MKTALLICDHVPEKFAKEHGNYQHMFHSLFDPLQMDDFHVVDGDFPDHSDYDAFVITGSRHGVYDDLPWISDLKAFTKSIFEEGKKCVGVCFGHQMIAEALGGKVEKSQEGFLIGLHKVHVLNQIEWMSPPVRSFKALMLCQDQVVKLPPKAKKLAETDGCPVAMFEIGGRFLGIQGHPEFSKAYNRAVFESREGLIGPAKIRAGIESLRADPDRTLMKNYILAFLNKAN